MILLAIATFVGASVQSATGFGFALVMAPALFSVFDAGPALLTSLTLGITLSVLVLGTERRRPELRSREFAWTMAAAAPGILIGLAVFAALDKHALQVIVGLAVLAAAASRIATRTRRGHIAATRPLMVATGLVSGTLTTTTGANGPPVVLLLERSGATPGQLRDTLAATFIVLDVTGIAVLVATADGASFPPLAKVLLLMGLTAVGHLVGKRIFHLTAPEAFRVAVLVLVVAVGMASIVAGLSGS